MNRVWKSVKSDVEFLKTQLKWVSNSFVRYEHAKSIQQNVCFECQTISENIQKPWFWQEKFKPSSTSLQIQGLELLLSNSRTFKFWKNPVYTPNVLEVSFLQVQIVLEVVCV
jgi:hypothetical protein